MRAAGRAGRCPRRQRRRRGVRWGGASRLADAAVHIIGRVGGLAASPRLRSARLQAAADGAAIVVVEKLNACGSTLHIVHEALLLGLELLVPLLQLPPVLVQPRLHAQLVLLPAPGCS
eukprot:scaffold71172_cov39-Phaeocystis_antarctica.AAC.1